jgi:tetratricopeptide (TPR) repeat protein
MGPAVAQAEAAIAEDPNNADAYAAAGYRKEFLGRSEDGFRGVETALRLSPRDRQVPYWQLYMCYLHAHLAQWEQAIEWCNKSAAANSRYWPAFMGLAAAHVWLGHMKEAQDAAAEAQKVYPGLTVQTLLSWHHSDDPTFAAQLQRIAEGLRKAVCPKETRRRIERGARTPLPCGRGLGRGTSC